MFKQFVYVFIFAFPTLAYIPATEPVCDECAENDIIFVIDSSESISESNYQTELKFVSNILSNSKESVPSWGSYIGYQVLVGVIIFDTTPWSQQGFLDNYNYDGVNSYLQSVSNYRTQGTSNLCAALNVAYQWFDQSANYWGRSKVPKTLVIFTDGDPNNAPGTCTNSIFSSQCNSLKGMGVEILTIAVSGSNGNQPVSNYPLLQQCASRIQIYGGSYTDLTYNVTDASSLYNIENSITSRMGCCSCFPDVSITLEMSEYTATTSAYLNQLFQTVNTIFSLLCSHGVDSVSLSVYNVFSSSKVKGFTQTVIPHSSCLNYTQIEHNSCPRATCATNNCDAKTCDWEGASSDIHAGLLISIMANDKDNSQSRPNSSIIISTGACDGGSTNNYCTNELFMSTTIADYQSRFAFRIGEVLDVAGGVTNKQMIEQVIGIHSNDEYTYVIDGPGDPTRTGNCISYQLLRWLSDQPGCSAIIKINEQNQC